MALNRVWIPSPNYSSRGGATVTTIVCHTAEGAANIRDLGAWFANPSSQVSSHVGIDDTPNTVGEYVNFDRKAWTAANANPWSVQAELCAFAAWTADDWAAHPTMLDNTAAWIAEEAARFGIPLRLLSASEAQNPNVAGVCQHNDLGAMGGGHWDCGPAFPIDHVLQLAQGGGRPPAPKPPEVTDMAAPCTVTDSDGRQWVFYKGPRGELWARCGSDAPFGLGGNVTDAISVIPGPRLQFDVYAYAPNGDLWSRHAEGYDWGDWYAV